MKILKRIAAMGAAVMMMASISSMGVSALDNTYSLYISNYGAVTYKDCEAGKASHNGYVNTTVKINNLSKDTGITYSVTVGKYSIGGVTKRITSSDYKKFTNTNIRNSDSITIKVRLAPSPTGIGSSASGSVSGS